MLLKPDMTHSLAPPYSRLSNEETIPADRNRCEDTIGLGIPGKLRISTRLGLQDEEASSSEEVRGTDGRDSSAFSSEPEQASALGLE